MHQGDRAGQRRANTKEADDAADPGRPHRVAHQPEVQRLAVRRAAAGPLRDVAYELIAAVVISQAALTMCQRRHCVALRVVAELDAALASE